MIEVQQLTKRYGNTVAVDEVSFVVQPGRVTGFLGPNGAGKSTTTLRRRSSASPAWATTSKPASPRRRAMPSQRAGDVGHQ